MSDPITMTAGQTMLTDEESEAAIMAVFDAINGAIVAHATNPDGSGTMDLTATLGALGYSLALYAAMRPDLDSRWKIQKWADGFSRDLVRMVQDAQADMSEAGLEIQ
jgi:hypothetical protein